MRIINPKLTTMKHSLLKRFIAIVMAIAIVFPASAQFAIGPRLGVTVNKFKFDESIMASDNRAGFTGGLQIEFVVPIVNLGFDLSAMYVHRSSDLTINSIKESVGRDYIEIPLNLKYKLGLPIVGKIISPYIFTGPSFAFLTSKKAISEFYTSKKCDISWNVGIGVQLISHLQIGASYGFGLNKAIEYIKPEVNTAAIEGKNRYWTITAAWLF